MNILRDELKKSKNGYEITIYLADNQTEFAEELGKNGGPDSATRASIASYVQKKYPNLKVTVAKVVLGGVVLGTIPLAGGAAHAAAAGPNDLDKASGYAKSAIERLVTQGVIQGDQTGAFNPQGTMTRDALTTVLVKALVGQTDLANPDTPTFKDVPKTHWAYQYIETAVQKGWIKGTSGDTFSPTGTVTREQLATILVRSLGLSDADVQGAGASLTFTDKDAISSFARDSVAFAVANGLMTGGDNNTFSGKGSATREQVAVVVDRFVTNKDKLQAAADAVKNASFSATAGDQNTITLSFKTAVDSLAATDVTVKAADGKSVNVTGVTLSEDKKTATVKTDTLTSGTTYTVAVNKQGIAGSATVTAPAALEFGAKPVGVKKIQVNFGTAVDDTKAKVTVKNPSGTALTVSDIEYSADKTSATVTVASSIVAGTYTVTASGVQSTDLSTTFTAEAEKVAKIEFVSDKAVISRVTTEGAANFGDADPKSVNTQFKITNQYGEDITAAKQDQLNLTTGRGAIDDTITNGVITITDTNDFVVGNVVNVTALDPDTNTFASAALTVASPSKVSEVTIDKLYNEDSTNTVLDVEDDPTDFGLLLSAKDQYGMDLTDPNLFAKDVVVTVSNESVASVKGGPKTPDISYDSDLGKFVLPIDAKAGGTLTAGTSKVTVVSTTTGKLASFDVAVKEAVKVDTLTLSAPTFASAGDDFNIPFTATDQDGNALTDVDRLTDGITSMKISGTDLELGSGIQFKKDLSTGNTILQVTGADLAAGTYQLTAVTGTNKVVTQKIVVTEAKAPAAIGDLVDFTKTFAEGATANFNIVDNLKILDQYDQALTDVNWGDGVGDYRIKVTNSNPDVVTYSGADTASGAIVSPTSLADGGNALFTAGTAGTSTITFQLQQNVDGTWKNVSGGDYNFKFKTVAQSAIKSYEAADVDTLLTSAAASGYDADNHPRSLTVTGVLADGSKVTLPSSYFSVTTSDDSLVYADGKLSTSLNSGFDDSGYQTQTVFVTITATGDTLEKTVKISNNVPKAAKLELVDGTVANKENATQVSIGLNALKGGDATVTKEDIAALAKDVLKSTDQYGVEITGDAYSVAASNFGGTTDTKGLDSLEAGSTFSVTANTGGLKQVFQVIVVADAT